MNGSSAVPHNSAHEGKDDKKNSNNIKPLPKIPDYGDFAIDVQNLTFAYNRTDWITTAANKSDPPNRPRADDGAGWLLDDDGHRDEAVLRDLNLTLRTGSRCLLIGANGSGKSTLLRILAGRHLAKSDTASSTGGSILGNDDKDATIRRTSVLGLHAFHDTRLNFHRAYLDCDWGMRSVAFVGGAVPLMADIAVRNMMERLQNSYPDRRDVLLDLLGIDLDWRMHQLSDGQRRRVQLFLGLVRPFRILLLDEVTTSLDVCVRQDLLRWLVKESEERGATILYATHIFDGLDDWATHLFYLTDRGRCGWQGPMQELALYQALKRQNHPCKMLAIAEHWLRRELEEKRRLRKFERAQGDTAHRQTAELLDRSQGGYASGRMETDEEREIRIARHSRISDLRGNAGILDKVRRVGN